MDFSTVMESYKMGNQMLGNIMELHAEEVKIKSKSIYQSFKVKFVPIYKEWIKCLQPLDSLIHILINFCLVC